MASLRSTKQRYERLHSAMTQAESRLAPVVQRLKDYVLYLKHNLNAQAVGALSQEVDAIEVQVEALIGDMNRSISEAQSFLKTFE